MTQPIEKPEAKPAGGRRTSTPVRSLDELVGAHLLALRDLYSAGKPADPAELGDAPHGRILSLELGAQAYMLTRPALSFLARDWLPWKGKEFDHGGNSGTNLIGDRRVLRFRAEVGPSELDGLPTLVLRYGEKAFRNPWPVSAVRDELRMIADGIAIGPAMLERRSGPIQLLWFGLERDRS